MTFTYKGSNYLGRHAWMLTFARSSADFVAHGCQQQMRLGKPEWNIGKSIERLWSISEIHPDFQGREERPDRNWKAPPNVMVAVVSCPLFQAAGSFRCLGVSILLQLKTDISVERLHEVHWHCSTVQLFNCGSLCRSLSAFWCWCSLSRWLNEVFSFYLNYICKIDLVRLILKWSCLERTVDI